MSAAAVLGGQALEHPGRSFSSRPTSSNVSGSADSSLEADAAFCLWENEPMSAAASLPSFEFAPVRRPPSRRVSGLPRTSQDAAKEEHVVASALKTGVSEVPQLASIQTHLPRSRTRSGVLALQPHRPAPLPPPYRPSSRHSSKPSDEFLEFEVTRSLTLKETPRSQRRQELQREIWAGPQAQPGGPSLLHSTDIHPHRTPGAHRVSFDLPPSASQDSTGLDMVQGAEAAVLDDQAENQTESLAQVDAAVEALLSVTSLAVRQDSEQLRSPPDEDLPVVPSIVRDLIKVDTLGEEGCTTADPDAASTMSRHASAVTLYESAHSGALSDAAEQQNNERAGVL